MKSHLYADLMTRALSADERTAEIRDDEGRLARIARDGAYPGAVCVRLEVTEDQVRYPIQWILPAIDSRPSFYPEDVPFLSGLPCIVKQASKRLYVIWDDGTGVGADPELKTAAKNSAPPVVRRTIDTLKARMAAGEPLGKEGLKEVTDMLSDESVHAWMDSTTTSGLDPRFVKGFERVRADCVEAGWREVSLPESRPFAHLIHRMAALQREDLQRALVLSGGHGMGHLSLFQEPLQIP